MTSVWTNTICELRTWWQHQVLYCRADPLHCVFSRTCNATTMHHSSGQRWSRVCCSWSASPVELHRGTNRVCLWFTFLEQTRENLMSTLFRPLQHMMWLDLVVCFFFSFKEAVASGRHASASRPSATASSSQSNITKRLNTSKASRQFVQQKTDLIELKEGVIYLKNRIPAALCAGAAKNSTCWVQQSSCVLPRSSLLSDTPHVLSDRE